MRPERRCAADMQPTGACSGWGATRCFPTARAFGRLPLSLDSFYTTSILSIEAIWDYGVHCLHIPSSLSRLGSTQLQERTISTAAAVSMNSHGSAMTTGGPLGKYFLSLHSAVWSLIMGRSCTNCSMKLSSDHFWLLALRSFQTN